MAFRFLVFLIVASTLDGVAGDAAPIQRSDGRAIASKNDGQQKDGQELVGKVVPEFAEMQWVDGKRRTLKELRGHPVLLRFWNRHCGMCKGTAPLLNELYDKYFSRGLIIIGVHHKKSKSADTVEEVKSRASEWAMKFPMAVDNDWKTVNRIWMYEDRAMTSATILVGKDGRILWVHPGGTIDKDSAAAKELDQAIIRALAAKT